MSWTLVQSQTTSTASAQSGALTVTFSATAAGNVLVVYCGSDQRAGVTLAPSDNQSQSYNTAVDFNPGGSAAHRYIFWINTVAGVTSISVTPSAFDNFWMVAEEWHPSATAALDVVADLDNGFATANPQSSGTTAAIAATTDLVVVSFDNPRGLGAAGSFSTPSGYTLGQSGTFAGATSGGAYLTAYNTAPSSGAQSAQSNISTSGSGWQVMGMIATFKLSAVSVTVAATGNSATTATNNVSVTGSAAVSTTGTSSVSSVGSTTETGTANVSATGSISTSAAGTVTPGGGSNVSVSGNLMASSSSKVQVAISTPSLQHGSVVVGFPPKRYPRGFR